MNPPLNVFQAVTHPDPYPYYANLTANKPIFFDDTLGAWVASSAEAVTTVLKHANPVPEPQPRTRPDRCEISFAERLELVHAGQVLEASRAWARTLEIPDLNSFMTALPAHTLGGLLGLPNPQIEDMKTQLMVETEHTICCARTQHALAQDLHATDASEFAFMARVCQATAGLIGNTVLALRRHPAVLESVLHEPKLLQPLIREIVRFDPPIHNMRCSLMENTWVLEQPVRAGEPIVVVLAAANRDPTANLNPNSFNPFRRPRASFTFGLNTQANPTETLVVNTARAGLERLLESGVTHGSDSISYRDSLSARIPVFDSIR